MHILYLSTLGGGLDTYVRTIGPALARVGHRVSVLYIHFPGSAIPEIRIDECTVYHATCSSGHYYAQRATLGLTSLPGAIRSYEVGQALATMVARIHRQQPLDLVEIPEMMLPLQGLPVPYIVRLHSAAWTWRRLNGEGSPWADRIEVRAERRTLIHAAGIASPSAYLAEYIRRTCTPGQRPIEIVPYPIDTSEFQPGCVKGAGLYVLFVGRVERRKGADVLLQAIPNVWAHRPDCRCRFAGSVNQELTPLIAGAGARVEMLGRVPRAQLIPLYQNALAFVAPSRWDNSPNTVYEAMACGTPVVASRAGGIPELVEDGVTGLLVPPGDEHALANGLLLLAGDDQRRRLMGEAGRQRAVAQFALPNIVARTLAYYERTLA